jgi:tripartite-type tricarboxylate transporter receptor subunit TctC
MPAITAVVSGEGGMSFQTPVAVSGLIASDRLRALAVTSKTRLSTLPNVPTIAESGVPGYEFNSWVGVLAPASTPPAIFKLLNEHIVKAAHAPEVAERVAREDTEGLRARPNFFAQRLPRRLRYGPK